MLGFPQAQVLDITGPLEVFARTARWLTEHRGARRPAYVTELVAERAGPLLMSSGLALVTTSTALARFVSSVAFGALWTVWGPEATIVAFTVALAAAIPVAAVVLHRREALA